MCVSWAALSNVFLTMDHEAKKSLKTPAGSYVSYFSCSKICVSNLLSEYIQFKFKVLKYLLVKMFFIDLLIKQVYDTHHPACYCIQDTVTLSGWHSAVIQLCVCTCTYTYEELIIRFSLKTIFSVGSHWWFGWGLRYYRKAFYKSRIYVLNFTLFNMSNV